MPLVCRLGYSSFKPKSLLIDGEESYSVSYSSAGTPFQLPETVDFMCGHSSTSTADGKGKATLEEMKRHTARNVRAALGESLNKLDLGLDTLDPPVSWTCTASTCPCQYITNMCLPCQHVIAVWNDQHDRLEDDMLDVAGDFWKISVGPIAPVSGSSAAGQLVGEEFRSTTKPERLFSGLLRNPNGSL